MTLGLCMIVKNEADVLGRCLQSANGLFDEIAVADTGSRDGTEQIARQFTDTVVPFRWQDDFAAARNFSFSLSRADYVMWLDADDVLLPADRDALLALKRTLNGETDAYFLPYRMGEEADAPVFMRERIVRRARRFVWKGAVHETLAVYGRTAFANAAVTHKKPPGKQSGWRNLCIYAKQFSRGRMPDERQKYYFARELKDNGLYASAAAAYEWFLRGNGWTENKIGACRDLAFCYKMCKKRNRCLQALLQSFRYAPPRPEICCDLGDLCFEEGDLRQAVFWYKLALNGGADAKTGAFVQPSCSGFYPCIRLCVCYDRLGEYERAAAYNERAGQYRPQDASYLHNKLYFEKMRKA